MSKMPEGFGVGRIADRHGTSTGPYMVVIHFIGRGFEPGTVLKMAAQLVICAVICWYKRVRNAL